VVALAFLAVVFVLIVIGVNSCDSSQANSDLRDYAVSVNSLMQSSQQTGQRLFTLLSSAQNSGNTSNLVAQVDQARTTASDQVRRARELSVPGQLQTAQRELVLALRMRVDGISDIGRQLSAALGSQSASNATTLIAAEMARFYASDVLYKDYALPKLIRVLKQAGIAVGGASGEPIFQGQFLPDVHWLTPSFVAAKLKAPPPATPSQGKSGATSYTVQSGDTLSGIAIKTGVAVATLQSLNPGISPSSLQVGQHLKLR
jgi:LysM repeat protein